MRIHMPMKLDISIELADETAVDDILDHIDQVISSGVDKSAELELQRLKEWILENTTNDDPPQVKVSHSVTTRSGD